MTPLVINIMRDAVGEPPEWSGDPESQAKEISAWMQWSVRKRLLEGTLAVIDAEEQKKNPVKPTRRSR